MLLSIIALTAAIIGFLGHSLWLFTAAIGFILVKMYPVLVVAGVIIGLGLLALRYFWRE